MVSSKFFVVERLLVFLIFVFGIGPHICIFAQEVNAIGVEEEPVVVVSNDNCTGALELTIAEVYEGTTVLAQPDTTTSGACGDSTSGTLPGVWFAIEGTGGILTASTCSRYTKIDTQISIFVATNGTSSCRNNELICVDGNDDDKNEQCYWELDENHINTHSLVRWKSQFNSVYYILVHASPNSVEPAGDFSIVVTQENDDCNRAVPLFPFYPEFGTITKARDSLIPDTESAIEEQICGSAIHNTQTANGLWYVVNGTGGIMEANTCEFATFDTQIMIFTGTSCDTLLCVDGNDDSCGVNGTQSSVTWQSEPDTKYYIYVHGDLQSSTVGEFVIHSDAAPSNDNCIDAIEVAFLQEEFGFTMSATPDSDTSVALTETCGDASASTMPGVWYSVKGTGGLLSASTCGFYLTFDTQISIFTGSCPAGSTNVNNVVGNDLICVDGNDEDDHCSWGHSTVTWESEVDSLYYILVHGYSGTGDFSLFVNEGLPLPVNNDCYNSRTMSFGDLFHGSTSGATVDDISLTRPICNGVFGSNATGAPGVWYHLVGSGFSITARTCLHSDFNNVVSVYAATSCNSLSCLDTISNAGPCTGTGSSNMGKTGSFVTWESLYDADYYIFVTGLSSNDVGEFSIEVIDQEPPPENDDCLGAVPLWPFQEDYGYTTSATKEIIETCSTNQTESNNVPIQGVWYSITGTGTPMSVGTCSYSNFDTRLSVYTTQGESDCDNLICVDDVKEISCGPYNAQHSVSWQSSRNLKYYILIHGQEDSKGEFLIKLTDERSIPSNDVCTDALNLSLDQVVYSHTVLATLDVGIDACGSAANSTSPGVWFSITGTGDLLTASTCDEATNFDTQISIFSGNCQKSNGDSDLICKDGNDDSDCGQHSTITWQSELNTVYYILVHGFSYDLGDFAIVITDGGQIPTVANDNCFNAVNLWASALPLIEQGSTVGALVDNTALVKECSINLVNRAPPGVWYSVWGTGFKINTNTCAYSSFDTQLSVYSGSSCNDLLCVNGDDDSCGENGFQSSVSWESELDTLYYIFVTGFLNSTGEFVITIISDEPAPINDNCTNAYEITLWHEEYGRTAAATVEDIEISKACNIENDNYNMASSPGVWYFIYGTGATLQADTCKYANFDTVLTIFTGSCSGLRCVESNNDSSCGNESSSSVTWESKENTMYYILVTGFSDDSVGEFRLDVVDVSTKNDNCMNATLLQLNHMVVGSTIATRPAIRNVTDESVVVTSFIPDKTSAVKQVGLACGIAIANTKAKRGLWYSIIGNDDVLQVNATTAVCNRISPSSSSSNPTAFDAQVSIFSGDCDDQICIDVEIATIDSCTSVVSWGTKLDIPYYIYVDHQSHDKISEFSLIVSSTKNSKELGADVADGTEISSQNVDEEDLAGSNNRDINTSVAHSRCDKLFVQLIVIMIASFGSMIVSW